MQKQYARPRFLSLASLVLGSLTSLALPALGQELKNHSLSNVQGDVRIQGWWGFGGSAVSGYRIVSTSDKVRVGPNGRVTLTCSNGDSFPLPSRDAAYRISDYCDGVKSRNTTRSTFNANLPYLLSPRDTTLLSDTPIVLSWNDVEGATSYEITVSGEGVSWTTEVDDVSVTIPSSEVFQPIYTYAVTITTDTGLSSQANSTTRFSILPANEVERVRSAVDAIQAEQYEPDTEAIALAVFYKQFENSDPDQHSFSLNHAALEVLETRIAAGTTNSQIFLLQGDIYSSISLPLEARASYEQALSLAKQSGQQDFQVQSRLGLATIAENLTEYETAIEHLRAVRMLYEPLDEVELQTLLMEMEQQAEALDERIQELEMQVADE